MGSATGSVKWVGNSVWVGNKVTIWWVYHGWIKFFLFPYLYPISYLPFHLSSFNPAYSFLSNQFKIYEEELERDDELSLLLGDLFLCFLLIFFDLCFLTWNIILPFAFVITWRWRWWRWRRRVWTTTMFPPNLIHQYWSDLKEGQSFFLNNWIYTSDQVCHNDDINRYSEDL